MTKIDESSDATHRESERHLRSLMFSEREDCADWAERFEPEALVNAWKLCKEIDKTKGTFIDAQFTVFRPRMYVGPEKESLSRSRSPSDNDREHVFRQWSLPSHDEHNIARSLEEMKPQGILTVLAS